MRQKKKLALIILLMLCCIFNSTAAFAFDPDYEPPAASKYDVEKPEFRELSAGITFEVDDITYNSSGKRAEFIEVTYTIDENASGDLVITFDDILGAIDETGYAGMPASRLTMKVNIVNNSPYEYTYQDQSLLVTTLNTAEFDNPISGAVGFDQQVIPKNLSVSRTVTTPMTTLVGTTPNIDKMVTLDTYLAAAGYTGPYALTQYYLDTYGDGTARRIEDLPLNNIGNRIFGGQPAKQSYSDGDTAERERLLGLVEGKLIGRDSSGHNYVKMDGIAASLEQPGWGSSDPQIQVLLAETDTEIIAASYNLFYNELFSLSFDTTTAPLVDTNSAAYSIGSYMRKDTAYTDAETAVFNDMVIESGQDMSIDNMQYYFNGPYTSNGYMYYAFGYRTSFILNPDIYPSAANASVTLNKIDKATEQTILDTAKFILVNITDDGDKLYYAENGSWMTDKADAKELATVNGTFTVGELAAGKYELVETAAPEGYQLASEAYGFELADDDAEITVKFPNEKVPEPTEPTKPTEPTEPTEATEPTEPTEPTKPTEPTDPTDPTKPTDSETKKPGTGSNNSGKKPSGTPGTSDHTMLFGQVMLIFGALSVMTLISVSKILKKGKN